MEQENKPSKPRFSKLTDILVLSIVIAIIVYLAFSILTYINRPPKRRAKEIICRSNLKHISQGVILYSQGNDAKLPAAEKWNDLIFEYTRNDEKIYRCPSLKKQEGKTCTYIINHNLNNLKGPLPTDMVLLFDGPVGWNQTGGAEDMVYRHGSKMYPSCNVALGDGSVIRVKKSEAANLKWKPLD